MRDSRHGDQVTRLLQDADRSDEEIRNELLPLVYEHLRQIARRRMSDQGPGHTLQATALVHEAYVRLVGRQDICWSSRAHFFFAASRAMQDILVEHARAKGRLKRGGAGGRAGRDGGGAGRDGGGAGRDGGGAGRDGGGAGPAKRVPLSVVDLAADVDADEILALTEAMQRLQEQQPDVANVVRLRFYAGLTCEETAAALGVSSRQVGRTWSYARAWLYREARSSR